MLKGIGKRLLAKGKGMGERARAGQKRLRARKLDKRWGKRATVPTGSVYRRRLVPPSQRPELLRYLRQNLFKPNFFENLPNVHEGCIRRLDFHFYTNGKEGVVPVAIKDTDYKFDLYPRHEGKNFKDLRKIFLAHQQAVKKGRIRAKKYLLRSPKVYGTIGDFLVMEYIAETPLPRNLWKKIWPELETNLSRLGEKGPEKGFSRPQAWHAMPVANTNPKSPLKGKWVVFLPYDYA